jgi:hypothetical protein
MSDSTQTVEVAQSKTTTNYGVYDAPDGDEQQQIVGMYISDGITEQLGEFISVTIDTDGEPVPATLDRVTSGYGVFSTDAEAIESVYVSHALLSELVDGYNDEESVESIGVSLAESDEEAFEDALDAVTVDEDETEQEAEALLAGGAGESETESDEEEEEIEISDEELDLVSDD